MIVIAYSERRRRITEGRSTRDKDARKSLRKLREREGDVVRKTARIIEEIAKKHNTALVVGNTHRSKSRMASNARKSLRHRIHQCCASKIVEILNNKPLHVLRSQRHTHHQEIHLAESPSRDIPPL